MTWPTAPLGELCTKIGSGATPRGGSESYRSSGIALVRSMNVLMGRFEPDGLAFIDENQAARLSNVVLEPDDVLLNITGASVARSCTLDNSVLPARVNQHVCILRPEPKKLNYQYLMRYLTAGRTQKALLQIAGAGATREAITKVEIQKFQIPLPPLAEQKRIARILDAADALRAKRRESLAQLDTLLQSVFLDMFGNPATNPMGWDVRALGDLADNEDGRRVPVKKADRERMAGEFPYYGASGVIDFVDNYLFDGERLLIGEDGANLVTRSTPIAFIAKGRYWVNNHAHVLAFNGNAELVFLEAMINSIDLKPYLSGSAQPKLNQSNLNRIPVGAPPIELQRQFGAIVHCIEQQKAGQQAHVEELDTLFASLQSRAFRGDL